MKTAIIGSRIITDYQLLKKAMQGKNATEIISGGASGADQLAERYAKEHGLPLTVFPADWAKYGKQAGMIRNQQIVKEADCIVALWDGQSKGTEATIRMAKNSGKLTKVVTPTQTNQTSLF